MKGKCIVCKKDIIINGSNSRWNRTCEKHKFGSRISCTPKKDGQKITGNYNEYRKKWISSKRKNDAYFKTILVIRNLSQEPIKIHSWSYLL